MRKLFHWAAYAQGPHVRHLFQVVQTPVAPVADGIEPPCRQPRHGHCLPGAVPVLAVLPLQIRRVEVESAAGGCRCLTCPRPPGLIMRRQRIVLTRQPLEHLLPALNHRAALGRVHRIQPQRKEQVAARRDQPPLAVPLYRVEVPGRLQLRPGSPAAVLVAVRHRRPRLQFGLLVRKLRLEVRFTLHLAGPVRAACTGRSGPRSSRRTPPAPAGNCRTPPFAASTGLLMEIRTAAILARSTGWWSAPRMRKSPTGGSPCMPICLGGGAFSDSAKLAFSPGASSHQVRPTVQRPAWSRTSTENRTGSPEVFVASSASEP